MLSGKLKLFCIPYGGSSASIYSKWKNYLYNFIELYPIEFKGHGKRFNNPFYKSFDEAVDDIFEIIINNINDTEYALFGHSMGSMLIFDIISKIKNEGLKEPLHLFFSGTYPPHIKKENKNLHLMTDENFLKEVMKYGGIPEEIFKNKDQSQIFIDILKADYKILETKKNSIVDGVIFNCPITALTGANDWSVSEDEIKQWGRYTKNKFNYFIFEGGHFFINEKTLSIINIINNTLNHYQANNKK